MVKAIKEAVGTSAVPAGSLEVKEAGFNTAYNRIEKEIANE